MITLTEKPMNDIKVIMDNFVKSYNKEYGERYDWWTEGDFSTMKIDVILYDIEYRTYCLITLEKLEEIENTSVSDYINLEFD